MQQYLPWIFAALSLALLLGAGVVWALRGRQGKSQPLPTEWTLTARPVFSAEERRVFRQLREALPHHIVLSKLPLVRFSQPTDPAQVRYWYDLLGALHVSFAVCSANGRVLAAIDLESERAGSRRSMQIKQSVLNACKVRYLRCPASKLPTVAELQLLVPQTGPAARGPLAPPPAVSEARDQLASTLASKRRARTTLWNDSGYMQDSFFGTADGVADPTVASGFGQLGSGLMVREVALNHGDIAAIVEDPPPAPVRH